jgi:hypothetical protein
MVKSVLHEIRDKNHHESLTNSFSTTDQNKDDRFVAKDLTWISPEQIDLLSDDEKKAVLNTLLTKILVFYDAKTGKHRLDIEFSAAINGFIDQKSSAEQSSANPGETPGGLSATFGEARGTNLRDYAGVNSVGNAGDSSVPNDKSLTVE